MIKLSDALRRLTLLGCVLIIQTIAGQAQDISRLEYFVDTDPGFGSGTPVPITAGTEVDASFSVGLNTMPDGFHHLYVRAFTNLHIEVAGDSSIYRGGWSQVGERHFFKTSQNTGAIATSPIARAEYFIDQDPGLGRAVSIPVTPSDEITDLSFVVDLTGFSVGFHRIFVRAQDQRGNWGHAQSRTFFNDKIEAAGNDSASVVAGEYFVDTDPGFGSGTPLTLTPGPDISNLLFSLDLGAVGPGAHQLFVRFKDNRGTWGQTNTRAFYHDSLSTADTTRAKLVAGEYFIDDDPGFGNGTSIAVNGNLEDEELSLSVDISSQSDGFHKLFVRFKDSKNNWGLASATSIYKQPADVVVPDSALIVSGEYFIDTDPGFGSASPLTVTSGKDISNLLFSLDLGSTSPGAHQLFVRFRDDRGSWGQTNTRAFYHDTLPVSDTTRAKLIAGEYFIDTDPGFGSGTRLPVSLSADSQLSIAIDINTLPAGFHRIFTRFQDTGGSWGLTSSRVFFKEVTQPGVTRADVVRGEYFLGNDPGFGNGIPLTLSAGPDLQSVIFSFNIDTLNNGFHQFFTRFQDSKGKWGLTDQRGFYKQKFGTVPTPPDLGALEYFLDEDPGLGKGKKLSISPTTNLSDFIFEVDTDSLELGDHTFYIRAQDTKGKWSLTNMGTFRWEPQSGLYVTIGQIEQDICVGSRVAIPFKTSGPFSEGNSFSVQLSDQFGSFANPRNIGSIAGIDSDTIIATIPNVSEGSSYRVRIVSSNPEKTSVSNATPLSIHSIPPVFAIGGDSVVCFGTSQYALTNFANDREKYLWSLADGGSLSANEDKAAVNWTSEGIFTLKVKYTGFCAAEDSVKTLDVRVVNHPLTGTFQNVLPANGTTNLALPITFSWSPIPNASTYDVFIWKENETKPSTPTVGNITSINYTMYNTGVIEDESAYIWQVVARMACFELEGPIQIFNTRQLPDLIVENISVPSTAVSETELSVNWRIKNQGAGGTGSGTWGEIVYLSDQPVLGAGTETYNIAFASNFSALGAGQSYTSANYAFRLPQGIQGTYYVIVQTNYYNNLKEKVTTNNQLTSAPITITLAPHPDLVVKTVTVSPLSAFSEDEITVTYMVENQGAGPTTANAWYDQISIGTTETANPGADINLTNLYHNGPLVVNETYTVTQKVRLPQRINGTYYIHVGTDTFRQVFEYVKEDNNSLNSLAMNIIQRPTANLVITAPRSLATSAANGQSVNVSWTTVNDGAAETNQSWIESVYLSEDQTFNQGADILIHSITRSDHIASLGSSNTQQSFALPQNLPAKEYYFFVVTDAQNHIYENPGEEDNVSSAFGKITIRNPDLRPLTFVVPPNADSGREITLQWTVRDDSDAGVHNNIWYDGIYLSTDQNLDMSTDVQLASVMVSQVLAKGTDYTQTREVMIPASTSGNYYLILAGDHSNTVMEMNESNNTLAMPISITLSPWPDLDVADIAQPASDTLGTLVNISYEVKNTGAGALTASSWTDVVYLSPVDTLDESRLIQIGTTAQSRTLAANASYTQHTSFLLPGYIPPGAYYIVVKSDPQSSIFENGQKENNLMISPSPVNLVSSPLVDLSVIGGKILSPNVTAGQSVDLEWTVRNNGAVPTAISAWTDAVYLSKDVFFDDTDVLIASQPVSETLASAATYRKTLTVQLPQEIEGNVYFLIMADSYRQHNDTDRGNNIIPLTSASGNPVFPVQLPLPADLVPSELTVAENAIAGGVIPVSFKVKNEGAGPTPAMQWTDQVFLSTDTQLGNDIPLGSFQRIELLDAGGEYVVAGEVTLPANMSGNYILLLKTDLNNQVFERGKENNNITYKAILIGSQVPADLTVSDITVPSGPQIAGSNSVIGWKLNNVGSNAVSGTVREAVYISTDQQLDASDVLFGTLDETVSIAAQSSIDRSLQMPLANLAVGPYFVIVKTDILNAVAEQNEDNNQSVSVAKLTVDIRELHMNILTAAEIQNGAPSYYRLQIPANLVNETLSITLKSNGAADAVNRLFLRKNDIPNVNQNDFFAATPFEADQELTVPALAEGTYYLMVLGTGGQPVDLLARIIPFGISAVESNKGGNTGQVTVKIAGAKFEPGMTVSLSGPGNHVASRVFYSDPAKMFATFNLNGAMIGKYNVQVSKQDGAAANLADGFEVIAGTPGGVAGALELFSCQIQNIGFDENIAVNLIHPASVRRNTKVKLTVAYTNAGNVDIPAQTRLLMSLEGAPINFTPDFSVQPSELELHLVESDGPSDILRAGSTGYINFYVYATGPISLIITQ